MDNSDDDPHALVEKKNACPDDYMMLTSSDDEIFESPLKADFAAGREYMMLTSSDES
jgi:hypothetical protein